MSNKNIVNQLTLKEVDKITSEVVVFFQRNPEMFRDLFPFSFEILMKHSVTDSSKKEIEEKVTVKRTSTKLDKRKTDAPSIIETYLTASEREAHLIKIKDILSSINQGNSIDELQSIELLRRVCKTKYYDESTEQERSLIISLVNRMLADKQECIFNRLIPSVFYRFDQFELSLSRDGQLVSIKTVQQEIEQSKNGIDISIAVIDSKSNNNQF